MSDTKVRIYYGPLSWFKAQIESKDQASLLDVVYERDDASRKHTVVIT